MSQRAWPLRAAVIVEKETGGIVTCLELAGIPSDQAEAA
jgi:hypothetical protein